MKNANNEIGCKGLHFTLKHINTLSLFKHIICYFATTVTDTDVITYMLPVTPNGYHLFKCISVNDFRNYSSSHTVPYRKNLCDLL